jgi:hypothetical protein
MRCGPGPGRPMIGVGSLPPEVTFELGGDACEHVQRRPAQGNKTRTNKDPTAREGGGPMSVYGDGWRPPVPPAYMDGVDSSLAW